MNYFNLGNTGLKVSRLCMGCMSSGSPTWQPWILEEEASRPYLRRALDEGINFFDTADIYSRGRSEEILGNALHDFGVPRHEVVIATKLKARMGPDPNNVGQSRKRVFHAIDEHPDFHARLIAQREAAAGPWTRTRFSWRRGRCAGVRGAHTSPTRSCKP